MRKILKFGDTYRFKTKGSHKLFNYIREGKVVYTWADAFADVSGINDLEIVESQDYGLMKQIENGGHIKMN